MHLDCSSASLVEAIGSNVNILVQTQDRAEQIATPIKDLSYQETAEKDE